VKQLVPHAVHRAPDQQVDLSAAAIDRPQHSPIVQAAAKGGPCQLQRLAPLPTEFLDDGVNQVRVQIDGVSFYVANELAARGPSPNLQRPPTLQLAACRRHVPVDRTQMGATAGQGTTQ
jgi:hypothetical protein